MAKAISSRDGPIASISAPSYSIQHTDAKAIKRSHMPVTWGIGRFSVH